jgi:Zn-dependent M16 (insulinase) family peptidase
MYRILTKTEAEKRRLKAMSSKDAAKIERQVKFAVKENEVNLSHPIFANMPSIPDVSKAASIDYEMENISLEEENGIFNYAQVVITDTAFCHFGFAIHIGDLPNELRQYLVIFQELLFQSSLSIPGLNGTIRMDYKEVAKYVSEVFVSHECGVGFGNSIFSVSYLGQLFTLFIAANPQDWDRALRFAIQVFLFSEFQNDRILTVAKNLISNIVDIKRDGSSVMSAVSNRIVCDPKHTEILGNNEAAISIFEQELFLKAIVKLCEEDSKEVIIQLEKLRSILLSNFSNLNFFRIATPFKFQIRNRAFRGLNEIATESCRIWNAEFEKFDTGKLGKKRKMLDSKASPFPFPRIPYSLKYFDSEFSKAVIVPVGGLTTCYLTQFVPCDLVKSYKDPDYFPTVLLAEILSRTEGPLYTGIRGQGFAYGAYLNCFIWAGQLSFELYRSSEPKLALECFYDILRELDTPKGLEKYCSDYEIHTAQASIAYRWASYGSTPTSVISTALRTSLHGFKELKEHSLFIQDLYKVTRQDLKRCFEKYFKLFFSDNRVTVLTTPTGDSVNVQQKSFQKNKRLQNKWYKIDFTVYNIKDFYL